MKTVLPYHKTTCCEFPDEIEVKLFEIFRKLSYQIGATYMSYTHDRYNSMRFSFRTDSQWANFYHHETLRGKPLIEQCPLDIASREKKNIFILWDCYKHKTQPKVFNEIMGIREDVGLTHGITLSTYFGNHHDAIAIATEDKKNDLGLKTLADHDQNLLPNFLLSCRKIVLEHLTHIDRMDDGY